VVKGTSDLSLTIYKHDHTDDNSLKILRGSIVSSHRENVVQIMKDGIYPDSLIEHSK